MNLVLTERYRPKNFKEVVGHHQIVEQIVNFLKEPLSMPNMLFVSKQSGTGKSSLWSVIKHELGATDVLILNSSDERKLETIRDVVKNFAISLRTNPETPRLVVMDEFDGVRADSQDALRFMMEQYSSNCKFLLTANNESKIIEPILSRCVVFRLSNPTKEDIFKRLVHICEEEQVAYNKEALEKLMNIFYPDMRKMINKIQELSSVGVTTDFIKTTTEMEDEFYEKLKHSQFRDVRKFVVENAFDIDDLLYRTLQNIIDDTDLCRVPNYKQKLKDIALYIAELNFRMRFSADKEIQMSSFILKWQEMFLE